MDEVGDIDVEGLTRWIEASVVSQKRTMTPWWHVPDAESSRRTKEALGRVHSTRLTVRNKSLLLPDEEAILICARS